MPLLRFGGATAGGRLAGGGRTGAGVPKGECPFLVVVEMVDFFFPGAKALAAHAALGGRSGLIVK